VIKARRDWQGVWHTDGKDVNRILVGKPEGKSLFEGLGVSRSIILKGILKKKMGARGLDSRPSG
jgi:hypothetical protein